MAATLPWRDRILRRARAITLASAALAALAVGGSSGGQSFQSVLTRGYDQLLRRSASGHFVIVELDARSLGSVNSWPWPRRLHARLVDELNAKGAARVAFDVDFASRSNPADDRIFAAALARLGGRGVLPALTQTASSTSSDRIDSLPIPMLRDHVMVAAVNVNPEASGQVFRMPMGMDVMGAPRPSLPALLADRSGGSDEVVPIDYSIDPYSIPRLSARDVLAGRFAPSDVQGRVVLIGATDIRLGDRYAVPGYGVLPGVVIQAVAAETMAANRPALSVNAWLVLLLSAPLLWLATRFGGRRTTFAGLALAAATLVVPLTLRVFGQIYVDVVPTLAAALAVAISATALAELRRQKAESLTDPTTGRPNRAALLADGAGGRPWVVAARIVNLTAITSAVREVAALRLLDQVMDRLEVSALDNRCYRLGGDRLALLASESDEGRLVETLHLLAQLMRTPVVVDGRALDVQVAFGYAPAPGSTVDALAAAELALQTAVANRAVVQSASREKDDDWTLSLLGELDRGLANGEMWVAFQPKMTLSTGQIVASEALVRWQHPTRGPIRPDEFIPFAEEHGRLAELTAAVLDRAIAGTRQLDADGHRLGVAVNISTDLLQEGVLAAQVADALARHDMTPERLTLEITESQPIGQVSGALACLAEMKALGVRLSVDDYGTGQSTLSYLKTLRADELKIDQSFVRSLLDSQADATLVRSTIELAHELGMTVVAEGVEDAATLDRLTGWGCDAVQGYHIARPMPLADLATRLNADRRAA